MQPNWLVRRETIEEINAYVGGNGFTTAGWYRPAQSELFLLHFDGRMWTLAAYEPGARDEMSQLSQLPFVGA